MSDKKERNYAIGYGKPPQATKFKPGQSGNSKGRPKGAKNLATLLDKILNEQVIVIENGKRKSISKLEATIKQLVNKAASGEHKFIQPLLQLVQLMEGRTEGTPDADAPVGKADQTVMQSILDRLRRGLTQVEEVHENDKEKTNENEATNDDDDNKT